MNQTIIVPLPTQKIPSLFKITRVLTSKTHVQLALETGDRLNMYNTEGPTDLSLHFDKIEEGEGFAFGGQVEGLAAVVQTEGAGHWGGHDLAEELATFAEQVHAAPVVVSQEDATLFIHADPARVLELVFRLAAVDEDLLTLLVHADQALLGTVGHEDVVAVDGHVRGHLEQCVAQVVFVNGAQAAACDVHDVNAGRVLAAAGQVDGRDRADAPVVLAGLDGGLQAQLVGDRDDVDQLEPRDGEHGGLQLGSSPRFAGQLQALRDERIAAHLDRLDARVLVVHRHKMSRAGQEDVADVRCVLVTLQLGCDLLQ